MGKAAKGGDGPGRDATGRKGKERIEYGTEKRTSRDASLRRSSSLLSPQGAIWYTSESLEYEIVILWGFKMPRDHSKTKECK